LKLGRSRTMLSVGGIWNSFGRSVVVNQSYKDLGAPVNDVDPIG